MDVSNYVTLQRFLELCKVNNKASTAPLLACNTCKFKPLKQ